MSGCQIPNGCLHDGDANACPLCDEDGADKIAEYYRKERETEMSKTAEEAQKHYQHGYADGVEWATKRQEALLAVYQEADDLWEVFEFGLRTCIGNTQYELMKEKLRAAGSAMDHGPDNGSSTEQQGPIGSLSAHPTRPVITTLATRRNNG